MFRTAGFLFYLFTSALDMLWIREECVCSDWLLLGLLGYYAGWHLAKDEWAMMFSKTVFV